MLSILVIVFMIFNVLTMPVLIPDWFYGATMYLILYVQTIILRHPMISVKFYKRRTNLTVRVRHPIRFRTPPDRIPYAVRSDCVRVTMTFLDVFTAII